MILIVLLYSVRLRLFSFEYQIRYLVGLVVMQLFFRSLSDREATLLAFEYLNTSLSLFHVLQSSVIQQVFASTLVRTQL